MDLKEVKKTLKNFGLKLTLPRLKVLEAFFLSDRGITHTEILELTSMDYDRVTIYRTLKSFEDVGVIHRIIGATGGLTYALSINITTEPQSDFKQHLHFCCVKCHGVFCLTDNNFPTVVIPDHYQIHDIHLTVVGICQACNRSHIDSD